MEIAFHFMDFLLHLDRHLLALIQEYGVWVYGLLFFIIFAETGFVVTPILPGDSLLFVAGALAAAGALDVTLLLALLFVAGVLGNQLNYRIGYWLGPKVFHYPRSRWFNPEYLQRTHEFYERHGGLTIVLARFLPIIRTFAPFVAGIGRMDGRRYVLYNLAGCALWVGSIVLAGYFLGNIQIVKENLTAIILGIVVLSAFPALIAWVKSRAS